MSEKDKALVMQARAVKYIDWDSIDGLIEQAGSEEAKELLRSIRSEKYHLEEWHAGCL